MPKLAGRRILVAEDDRVIAADVASALADEGATVLGPVETVDRAEFFAPEADGAILDIHLRGEPVYPLADDLQKRMTPFVFFTGFAGPPIPDRFDGTPAFQKPVPTRLLVDALVLPPPATAASGVRDALPELRRLALAKTADRRSADDLVERTLVQAVGEAPTRDQRQPVLEWLQGLLDGLWRGRPN